MWEGRWCFLLSLCRFCVFHPAPPIDYLVNISCPLVPKTCEKMSHQVGIIPKKIQWKWLGNKKVVSSLDSKYSVVTRVGLNQLWLACVTLVRIFLVSPHVHWIRNVDFWSFFGYGSSDLGRFRWLSTLFPLGAFGQCSMGWIVSSLWIRIRCQINLRLSEGLGRSGRLQRGFSHFCGIDSASKVVVCSLLGESAVSLLGLQRDSKGFYDLCLDRS